VVEDAIGQRERAGIADAAAASGSVTMGNGKVADADRTAGDVRRGGSVFARADQQLMSV
jgi:hypothetical protein